MRKTKAATAADVHGPWFDSDITTGLIERCKRNWNTPVSELSNQMLATFLNQQIALRLAIPEAQRRLANGHVDEAELYPEQLANALRQAESQP